MNNVSEINEQRRSRRELFAGVIRWAALAGVTLLSAGLLRRGAGSGRPCRQIIACAGCAKLADCTWLEAAAARAQTAGRPLGK
jgi:hypothetical protein